MEGISFNKLYNESFIDKFLDYLFSGVNNYHTNINTPNTGIILLINFAILGRIGLKPSKFHQDIVRFLWNIMLSHQNFNKVVLKIEKRPDNSSAKKLFLNLISIVQPYEN